MAMIGLSEDISHNRRLLIGSYLTAEYSIESAALFNPSIVPHHNQRNFRRRRAVHYESPRHGRGHVSSIVFRTGVITADHQIQIDPCALRQAIRVVPTSNTTSPCSAQAGRHRVPRGNASRAGPPADSFSLAQLEHAIVETRDARPRGFPSRRRSGHPLVGPIELSVGAAAGSGGVGGGHFFPKTDNESHGIEDLRMVRFVDDDGAVTYYGTCTAFDGYRVLPQLIETRDFQRVGVHTINAPARRTKACVFPADRGHYVMCSRIDGESLYIMYSDIVHFWETAELLHTPRYPGSSCKSATAGRPWKRRKAGCLLTHGVGPMRTYCIGAMLLDLNDP